MKKRIRTERDKVMDKLYRERNKVRKAAQVKAWQQNNREKRNHQQRQRVCGITIQQYNALLVQQSYRCALCKTPLDLKNRTHMDHCHITGKVRSILCQNCNTGIGLLKDSPELLRLAASYIEYWRAQHVYTVSSSE